jgi:alpha-1,6-mannosyltransferase
MLADLNPDADGPASVARDGRLWALLVACLVGSIGVYFALAVVLGSVPEGFTSVVGSSLESGPLFRALTGLPRLRLSAGGFSRALGGLLAAGWALWLAAVFAYARLARTGRARLLVIAGGCLLLALVVVLVPPVLSADLYRQASYGHMVARWGLNPYAVRAADVPWNPLLPFANQTGTTTIYGPAYTLVSALVAALAPATALGSALAWKTMAALAALGMALLAAPVARALDPVRADASLATLLLLWNPLVILESAGAAHVEPVMMLFALGGLYLMLSRRAIAGAAVLTLSTLTKWTTGALLALAIVAVVGMAPTGRRLRTLAGLLAAAVVTAVLCYAPFLGGLVGTGGMHELALRGGAPLGGSMRSWLPQWMATLAYLALVLACVWAARRAAWPRVVVLAIGLLLVFVLAVVPWLFPWYLMALMALAAVLPREARGNLVRLVCFGLGGGLMLYYAKLVALP